MTVTRLMPVAPRPLPGEAVLSWVRRVGARYDLTASELIAQLHTGSVYGAHVASLNWHDDVELDTLLASAARLDAARIRGLRTVRVHGQEPSAWHRHSPAWCPECLRDDLTRHGEVFERAAWGLGCCVVCPTHGTRLIQTCPTCIFGHCRFEPVDGCQRLICPSCRRAVDVSPRAAMANGAARQQPGLFGLLPSPELIRSVLAFQTDITAALSGAAQGSAGVWPSGASAGQFATMVRDLAGAFLTPRRLGGGRDARLALDDEGAAPARGGCAFAAVKAHVAFDLVGIVAAVVSQLVTGSPAGIHAAECRGLETRFVPIDPAWFTKRLTVDELEALCVTARACEPASAAGALCAAVTAEIAARKHAAAALEHARQEAAEARRAAARSAADAKRWMQARATGKGRRRRSIRAAGNRGRGGRAKQSEALRPLQQLPDR